VLLQHFWLGLSKESALQLNIAAGVSFTHKTIAEGEGLLDRILENTSPFEPIRVEPKLNHEEVSSAEAEPIEPLERPSPEIEVPEKGFQPSNLPYFKDDLFEDFGASRYSCQNKPPFPVTPLEPLDKEFLRESINELNAIISRERMEEVEFSSEEIQIHTPSSTIHCKMRGICVHALYNPSIRANLIISAAFASAYLGEKSLAPIVKSLRNSPRTSLKRLRILHDKILHHRNIEVALDFHVFEI
jgi:hypothetical protein